MSIPTQGRPPIQRGSDGRDRWTVAFQTTGLIKGRKERFGVLSSTKGCRIHHGDKHLSQLTLTGIPAIEACRLLADGFTVEEVNQKVEVGNVEVDDGWTRAVVPVELSKDCEGQLHPWEN
jgi:hypothetical protein